METITVKLQDGTEEQRPFTVRPGPRSREIGGSGNTPPIKVPVTHPGERAVPIVGGWLIMRS